MEHQDSVTRPFYTLIAAYCLFVVGCSIYFHEALVLAWGFGALLAAAIAWSLLALVNIAIFLPIFRLLAKLTGKQKTPESNPAEHTN